MTATTRLATPQEVAERLCVTTGQLAQMRYQGTGPVFKKVGKAVRYAVEDVDGWLAANTYSQTGHVA